MGAHDARYVIERRTGLTHSDLISNPQQSVSEDGFALVNEDLVRLKNGEPLSRIYGEREFWGMSFALSPDTLDPRPDTETLIEAVLKRYKDNPPATILDLGTGSGCILIALLKEFPNAQGVGVDRSHGAAQTAVKNAVANGVADRAHFICGDWAQSIESKFDLIVSNPPYIEESVIKSLDESVQNYDPILALSGGGDGLQAYKIIFSQIYNLLNLSASAFFEIGFDQSESVSRLSEESRFLVSNTTADLAGHIRVLELIPHNGSGDK